MLFGLIFGIVTGGLTFALAVALEGWDFGAVGWVFVGLMFVFGFMGAASFADSCRR